MYATEARNAGPMPSKPDAHPLVYEVRERTQMIATSLASMRQLRDELNLAIAETERELSAIAGALTAVGGEPRAGHAVRPA